MRKENKLTSKEWYIFLLAGICIVVTLGIIMLHDYSKGFNNTSEAVYDEKLLLFDDGWHGEDGELQLLPDLSNRAKNESISISRKLPDSLTAGTYLGFRSIYAYVDVYIDEERVYSSPYVSLNEKTKIPLKQWNYVSLLPEYGGKNITVTFQSPYAYYNGILPEIILGTHADVLLYTFSAGEITTYLSICIIALGMIMMLLSLINTMGDSSLRSYAYLGLFLAFIGLMLICEGNISHADAGSYYKDYVLFHASLRLSSIVYCIYMYSRIGERAKKIFLMLSIAAIVNLAVSMLLHFTGIMDFTGTAWAAFLLVGIPLILDIYFDVLKKDSGSIRYRIITGIGLATFFGGCMGEIFLKLSYMQNGYKSVLVLGALIFGVCQCISVIFFYCDIASQQIAMSKELDDKRIKLMMSQIQPHFIYNTLNTIRSMTKLEPDKAYDMIYHFSNYLKFNIDTLGDREMIPFSEELSHIRAYTAIECERFHRLKVIYEIEVQSFQIPPLTIQPFVENAIKHGICKKEGGGTVRIISMKKEGSYMVRIVDDGIGFEPEILSLNEGKKGIGITNASYRLRELSGAEVKIESASLCGCSVTISIPV